MYLYIYISNHNHIYIRIYHTYIYIYIYILKKKSIYLSNMYLYRFNCPPNNDGSLVAYANGRGSAVLTY